MRKLPEAEIKKRLFLLSESLSREGIDIGLIAQNVDRLYYLSLIHI